MITSELVDRYTPPLQRYEDLYRELHATPDLSGEEEGTARRVSQWLKELGGYDVSSGIGGHGVVGVLRNGGTKTVLLRAELDALPLAERTMLPFASTRVIQSVLNQKLTVPLMHACGHDLHMSAQLAAAELLYTCREHWQGTLIVLFQPSEENAKGAKAMVADGLYDPMKHNIPIPDVALGGHCMPLRAGMIKTRCGVINASADSFKVTIIGRGGHAARPHTTVDPVIVACNIVVKLQQIVSRLTNPLEPAVLTVGSIHAGSAPNIIADQATLEINIRAFNAEVRAKIIDSMTRIIHGEAQMHQTPEPPRIEVTSDFPLLVNAEQATTVVIDAMRAYFGAEFGDDATASAGSEDFADLSPSPNNIPLVFWNYGCIAQDIWDRAVKDGTLSQIPGQHPPHVAELPASNILCAPFALTDRI